MTKKEAIQRLEADLAGTDLFKIVAKRIKDNHADFYWSRKLEAYFIEIKNFDFAADRYDLCAVFVPDKARGCYTIGLQVGGSYLQIGVNLDGIDQRLAGLKAEFLERSRMDTISPESIPEPVAHFVPDLAAELPAEPESPAEPPSVSVDPDDALSYAQKLKTVLSALYYAQMYTQDLFLDCKQTLHALRQADPVDSQKISQYECFCDSVQTDFRRFGYFRDHPAALIGPVPEGRGPD